MDRNDIDQKLKKAQLMEVGARAEKALEKVRHEQAKREKTEEETKKIRMSRWMEPCNVLVSIVKEGVSVFGTVDKIRNSQANNPKEK